MPCDVDWMWTNFKILEGKCDAMLNTCDNCKPCREMTGVELIAEERVRQLREYDDNHDDGYMDEMLALVAMDIVDCNEDAWGLYLKNRESRIKQLTIAGALLAAEIDRLRRLSSKTR